MIISVTNFCQNIGKSTIVIYLAKYLIKQNYFNEINIIDGSDDQLLMTKFKSEESSIPEKIYVDVITKDNIAFISNLEILLKLKEQNKLYIVDLKPDFEFSMLNLLKYSDAIISPFASDDQIIQSSIEFGKLMNLINVRVHFVNNFYTQTVIYDKTLVNELMRYGNVVDSPISFTKNVNQSFLTVFNDELIFKKAFEQLSISIFN